METICLFVTVGLIMAVLFVGIGVCVGRLDKGELDRNRDLDSGLWVGSRDRSGDNGPNMEMEHSPEEMIQVLQVLRMGACRYEREILNELIDKLEKEN